jgi:uncharacterized caspase-like protein
MVTGDLLEQWLQPLRDRNVLVILDAVRSGGIGKKIARPGQIQVLTSSTEDQVSFERPPGDQSVFTFYLLEYLRQGKKPFTPAGAWNYVRERVSKYTETEFSGSKQTPMLYGK